MQNVPLILVTLGLLGVCSPTQAIMHCADLITQIESKLKKKGVTNYSLSILSDSAVQRQGESVVGSCDGGTKKIVYQHSRATKLPKAKAATLATSPALPTSVVLASIPKGSSVIQQLQIEESNYKQLGSWKALAESTAQTAVNTNNANLYRDAVIFRDRLLPYTFQFFSAYNVAQELKKTGYKAREAKTAPGETANIVTCNTSGDCRAIDPRVALFMTPVTLLTPSGGTLPRNLPPVRPLIQLIPFPFLNSNEPSTFPLSPGLFPPRPGQVAVPVPIPIPHPLPLPPPLNVPVLGLPSLPAALPPIDLGIGGRRVCVPWC